MPSAKPSIFLGRRVYYRNEDDPMKRAMAIVGWQEAAKDAAATIIWDVETLADTTSATEPAPHQLINRIPAMIHCCRKAVFARHISRLRTLLPPDSPLNDGQYLPMQWALPVQASQLAAVVEKRAAEAKKRGKAAPVYIVKPDGGSMGDGIQLTPDPCKYSWNASAERVCQEYIGEPLLVDGLKFDLRLYVLVTATHPVPVAYLYREGLARFAVDSYVPPSRENMKNVHMHLTNYSLNKKSENYKHSDAADGGDDGSKRPASAVFEALQAAGKISSVDGLWEDIGRLVGRTLGCLQPVLAVAKMSERKCFQVLGVDILLNAKGRPYLLEINDHPSFRIDLSYDEPGQYSMNGLNSIPSPVDEGIKVPMLASALRLVAMEHSLRLGRGRRRRARPKKAVASLAAGVAAPPDGGLDAAAAAGVDDDDDGMGDDMANDDVVGNVVGDVDAEDDHDRREEDGAAEEDGDRRVDEVSVGEGAPSGLQPPPSSAAARSHPTDGVHGTAFHPVPTEEEEGFELVTRLAALFEQHTPASVRRDFADPTRANYAHAPPPEGLAVPGPRWKGPAPFGAFLQSAGILARGGAAPTSKGGGRLARPDLDLIFLAVCGKGGSMDVMDFAEACVKVAQRVWPERADAHPSELLAALLDTYFPEEATSKE